MKIKKFLCAAFSTVVAFSAAAGLADFSFDSISADRKNVRRQQLAKTSSYSGEDFANSVEIGRNELTVDIQSVTSTPASKSATIAFNSVRLMGWGPSKKNVFVVIDDDDYSGSPSNPSLSENTKPVFNGYTIELKNVETAKISYTDSADVKHEFRDLIIPELMNYGTSFSIKNKKIVKDAFLFPKEKEAKFDYIVIPEGIEVIEEGAFKNIPDTVTIRCEAASKPTGWHDNWTDAKNVEFGYKLINKDDTGKSTGHEEYYLNQTTGTNTEFYGSLVHTASNSSKTLYSVINDVNWNGTFVSPYVRTTNGLTAPYHLDGYVAEIEDSAENAELYIPFEMKYSTDLVIENKVIATNAINFLYDDSGDNYVGSIKNIYIPKEIENVERNAFKDVPDSVTINCEALQSEVSWPQSWTDAKNVNWGVSIDAGKKVTTVSDTSRQLRLGNDATTYILGYKHTHEVSYYCLTCGQSVLSADLVDGKYCPVCGEEVTVVQDYRPEAQLPLVIKYDVKKSDGSVEEVWHEMPLVSEEATSTSTSKFDSVKISSHSRSLDILIAPDETLDMDSFVVYNIYRAKTVKIKGLVPEEHQMVEKYTQYIVADEEVSFYAKALKRFADEIAINEIINYEFDEVTTFTDYSITTMRVDKVLPSYWLKGIAPDVKATFQEFIDSGEYSIRYAFYNINNSYYRLTYYSPNAKGLVTTTIPIKTPNSVVLLEKEVNNQISFLLKNNDVYYEDANGEKVYDFSPKNLRQFELIGLTINIHLWNNSESIKVGRTDLSVHFGAVDVLPEINQAPSIYNIDLFIILFCIIYTLVYAGISVGLFFYTKHRFRNDEFRRIKSKSFIKNAILGYVGSLIVALTIIFICFRFGKFNNAVSVHNPIDIFIVLPGVLSVIVIGYFIKFTYSRIKGEKQRKQAKKLKLNEDVDDDGTN